MTKPEPPLLLDTCAVIWLSQGVGVSAAAENAIEEARRSGNGIRVSVMTAWELGMLVAKGRLPASMPADRWFEEFVRVAGVTVEAVTPTILVAASFLPGSVHGDPMDRILIASARERGLTVLTRDRAILAYGAAGHVRAIAC
ncbi:type II toxin-antitoxin system VapC family toxin [Jiella avicenniae]|uniref:Ribonuclease VapC n=1 Tax=Jiella avicenniae TaxID=2907202 RepID=A0A9X1NYM8_9HYPH|nr:type II toxin-antitoxin system VapC family toxin [Jiella avicenniae]MCE7028185.1 type II toxin-antitoxin system VapC family toxin [Jiella avicenniae]